jgi:hypothetical protein
MRIAMTHTLTRAVRLAAVAALTATVVRPAIAGAQDRDRDDRSRSSRPDFRWEKSLPEGSVVRVHDINGDISVVPSTSGRVEVLGIKRGSGRALDDIRAEVVETRDGIVVCVLWDDADNVCDDRGYHSRGRGDNNWRDRATMDLEVRVPSDVQVSANSVSGDVSISGARGEVSANSVSGDIRLDRIRATSVSAKTVSGNVVAQVEQLSGRGDLTFKSVSGDVTLELPRDLDADVSLTTVSGELDSDFQMRLDGRVSRRRIEARIGRGGRPLDISTVSGDVRLKSAR